MPWRSKAFTTTELMHMPPCLHGRRLNCSLLLPAGIICSSKRLIASPHTSRPISRIPCMYTHQTDLCRSLAKIRTKYGYLIEPYPARWGPSVKCFVQHPYFVRILAKLLHKALWWVYIQGILEIGLKVRGDAIKSFELQLAGW